MVWNGRQYHRKMTSWEAKYARYAYQALERLVWNGRQHHRKKTLQEDNLTGRQPHRKTALQEPPQIKMIS